MRFRLREMLLAGSIFALGAGCAIDSGSTANDNDPPLADLDELMDGALKADDIPREMGKFDHLTPKQNSELRALMSPVKSQARRGVCSIFSTVGLMEHLYIAAGHDIPDFSEQYLQWSTKFQLGAFPSSSGSNDGINLSAIAQFGIPEETIWPYQEDQWSVFEDPLCDGEDAQPTHCYTNGHPTDEIKNAPKFFLPGPRFVNPFDIKGQIMTNKTAVVAGMTFFYQSWNHRKSELPTNDGYWNQGYVLYPNAKDKEASTSEELRAGHAIVIFGWDDELEVPIVDENGQQVLDGSGNPVVEKGFYIFKNSWGTVGFGIDHELGPGYGYISQRYIHEYASVRTSNKPAPPATKEICNDGIDNDSDLLIDCADPGCSAAPECNTTGVLVFPGPAGMAIPDNDTTGISSSIDIDDEGSIADLSVDVAITHTFRGDLRVSLQRDGETVVLHDQAGGSAKNLVQSFSVPAFTGASLAGTWQLVVQDLASIDTGTLDSWTVKVRLQN